MPRIAFQCRYCGTTREAYSQHVGPYSTCGSDGCKRLRFAETGALRQRSGTTNPKYRDGQWAQESKNCAHCGAAFTGFARRKFCSPSCSNLGRISRKGAKFTDEQRAKLRGPRAPKSEEWKNAMSVRLRGENNPNWLGGRRNDEARATRRYALWSEAVKERDGYRCRMCSSEAPIVSHHIKEWMPYPDLRYVVENGITLCKSCHVRVHRGSLTLPSP